MSNKYEGTLKRYPQLMNNEKLQKLVGTYCLVDGYEEAVFRIETIGDNGVAVRAQYSPETIHVDITYLIPLSDEDLVEITVPKTVLSDKTKKKLRSKRYPKPSREEKQALPKWEVVITAGETLRRKQDKAGLTNS